MSTRELRRLQSTLLDRPDVRRGRDGLTRGQRLTARMEGRALNEERYQQLRAIRSARRTRLLATYTVGDWNSDFGPWPENVILTILKQHRGQRIKIRARNGTIGERAEKLAWGLNFRSVVRDGFYSSNRRANHAFNLAGQASRSSALNYTEVPLFNTEEDYQPYMLSHEVVDRYVVDPS